MVCLVIFSSCNPFNYTFNFPDKYDYASVITFDFHPDVQKATFMRTPNLELTKKLITEELNKKGVTRSDEPDVFVNIFAVGSGNIGSEFSNRTANEIKQVGSSYTTSIKQDNDFAEGTLYIDISRRSDKLKIWESSAGGVISPNPEQNKKVVEEVIRYMFDNYPPDQKSKK